MSSYFPAVFTIQNNNIDAVLHFYCVTVSWCASESFSVFCICARTKACLCTAWSAWCGPACKPIRCPCTQCRSRWQHPQVNVQNAVSQHAKCWFWSTVCWHMCEVSLGFEGRFQSILILALLLQHAMFAWIAGLILCLRMIVFKSMICWPFLFNSFLSTRIFLQTKYEAGQVQEGRKCRSAVSGRERRGDFCGRSFGRQSGSQGGASRGRSDSQGMLHSFS